MRELPATVFGTGCTVRDYIHVDDIAGAVIASPAAGVPHTRNVGTWVGTSLLQIMQLLEQSSGRAVTVQHLPARGFDVEPIVLDVGAFRALTGHEPFELTAGLTTAYGWALDHAGTCPLAASGGDS